MDRRIPLPILALAVAACQPAGDRSPTHSQDRSSLARLEGSVLRAGCRQGECSWLRVARVETVQVVPQGELRRIAVRHGRSRYGDGDPPERYSARLPVEWAPSDHDEYAFCSTERPAYAFARDGDPLTAHFLDLFDLAGYQYASAGNYLKFCHGEDFDPAAEERLRRLGYRPGTRSEQVEDAAPGDLARF